MKTSMAEMSRAKPVKQQSLIIKSLELVAKDICKVFSVKREGIISAAILAVMMTSASIAILDVVFLLELFLIPSAFSYFQAIEMTVFSVLTTSSVVAYILTDVLFVTKNYFCEIKKEALKQLSA